MMENEKLTDLQNMTVEEAFQELDEMVKKMESNEISLDESFQLYNEGMKLLKYCNDKIDKVEKKMLMIGEDGEAHEF